jgi:hypothetical protein
MPGGLLLILVHLSFAGALIGHAINKITRIKSAGKRPWSYRGLM